MGSAIFVDNQCKMSLLRTGRFLPRMVRQCARMTVAQHQPRRGYAEESSKEMAFTFATPGDVFYNEANVQQVDVSALNGSFGILPNHVPALAVLKPGLLTVRESDGNVARYFVSSGNITTNEGSSMQILAEEAGRIEDFDAQEVREGLAKAQHEVSSASTEQAKAEAQIAVECYEELQKALTSAHV